VRNRKKDGEFKNLKEKTVRKKERRGEREGDLKKIYEEGEEQ
jgi:hypothetical protein